MPKQDVGQAFLKHEVMANEVFLGLVPQDGKTWAKVPREFRWILGEYLDLPFEDYSRIPALKLENRRLQPDAILEITSSRTRFFIEYETGSATVRDAKKSTSTMAKLDRYGTFFCARANPFAGVRETYYERAFKDGWPAEVLFVTRSEARRDSIARVIVAREHTDKYKFTARALTLTDSGRTLCRALYGADQPPGGVCQTPHTASARTPPVRQDTAADAFARTAAEERLRRGRVSVRGEQLVMLEKLLRSSLDALNSTVDVLTRMRLPTEPIPAILRTAPGPMRVLSEYARRGREALARYGLTVAD